SPAGARHALPLQPDGLAVGETGRDLGVDLLAGRQMDAPRCARQNLRQRDGDGAGDVTARRRTAEILLFERLRPPAAAGGTTEHFLEDIVDPAATAETARAPAPPAATLETVGTPRERFEIAVLAGLACARAPGSARTAAAK